MGTNLKHELWETFHNWINWHLRRVCVSVHTHVWFWDWNPGSYAYQETAVPVTSTRLHVCSLTFMSNFTERPCIRVFWLPLLLPCCARPIPFFVGLGSSTHASNWVAGAAICAATGSLQVLPSLIWCDPPHSLWAAGIFQIFPPLKLLLGVSPYRTVHSSCAKVFWECDCFLLSSNSKKQNPVVMW